MKWALAAALILITSQAVADPVLSSTGADLGRVSVSGLDNGLRLTVDIGEDQPSAAHVIARFQNNQPLMQGRDGLWAPWSGDQVRLDEAATSATHGRLTFHLLTAPLPELFFPVSFTLIYRTHGEVKFGILVVDGP